jgi:TolB-like protein/Flp pilus assembly protein TadD
MRIHFGGLTFDAHAHELRRGSDRLHLSPKAFRLLEVLIEERPAAVTKERLFELIWPETIVAEANLPSLIKEIRRALDDDARDPKIIVTVFGHGYSFGAEATVEESPSLRSVAVLPFSNASGPDWDYVGDGIAEGVLNVLAKLPGLRVVPRSTSFRYRDDADLRSVAAAMRVDAIVTGRISARGDSVSVQTELVNAKTDSQVWGGRFQGGTADLLHVQRQIETAIIARIAEQTRAAPEVVRAAVSRQDEAYPEYMRGQHHLNQRDADGVRRAVQALRLATDIEPSFALAHATLAEAYVAMGSRDLYPPSEIFPLARAAATRAIELDPTIPGAHTSLAAVQELFDWDWERAGESHRVAVELEPHATAAQWFALYWARRGIHDEAQAWIRRALKLEPVSPSIITNAALVAYLAHDYQSAIQHCERALELMPHMESARVVLGVVYIQVDPSRAIQELEASAHLWGRHPFAIAHLASAYAAAGNADAAKRVRDEVLEKERSGYVSATLIGLSELAAGERSKALDAFERAGEQRSPWLSYSLSEPRLDPLRDDPRMRKLLASIGFGAGGPPAVRNENPR